MPARLIVNADDFGLTAGINRSVGELHQAGALRSATLMASGAAFDDAVAIARANPGLGIGCHLVFIDGTSVCDSGLVPSLVEAGKRVFRASFCSFAQAALLGSIAEDDLVREGMAQVEKLQAAGIAVTHLDTHKHTHMLPIVARAVLRVAAQCRVDAIRNPFEPAWSRTLGRGGTLRKVSVRALDTGFHAAFDDLMKISPGIRTTDGTIGVAATGRLTIRRLEEMISAVPPYGAWEMVVHPGYDDADLAAAGTRLRASREIERLALAERMSHAAKRRGIPLIHYGEL